MTNNQSPTKLKTLLIVHELALEDLKNSIEFLRTICDYEIKTINIAELLEDSHSEISKKTKNPFASSSEKDKINLELASKVTQWNDTAILTLHLSLDNEIANHKAISEFAKANDIKELNPYSIAAENMDSKMNFYNLMQANDIKCPETFYISREYRKDQNQSSKLTQNNERKNKINCEELEKWLKTNIKNGKIIIKPNHGTEGIDVKCFPKESYQDDPSNEVNLHIKKILEYDDCLIQEYIEHDREHRVVIFENKILCREKLNQSLINFCLEIYEIINHNLKEDEQILTIAFDILESKKQSYTALEANARPAAIFKSKTVYQL